MKFRFIVLVLIFSILLPASYAQAIHGTVVDADTGEGLVGAHIMLLSDWRLGTTADVDGNFKLELPNTLAGQKIQLVATFLGYLEQVVTVNDIDAKVSIGLKASRQDMEAITITGDKLISDEFAVRKMNRMDIYQNPSAKADPLLAVNSLPSSTTLDESANISFRGGSPNQTGIFFNNVPVYDAVRFSQLNGIGTFSIFNTDLIGRLNVYPGSAPLEFGNSTGGLIAIESTSRLTERAAGSILLSPANCAATVDIPLNSKSSIFAYSNYQMSGPLKFLNPEALDNINSFESLDAGVHFILKGENGSQLKVFNYSLWESYDVVFRSASYDGSYIQDRSLNMTIANYSRPLASGILSINSGYTASDFNLQFSRTQYDIRTQSIYSSVNFYQERKRSALKFGLAYDGRYQDFDGHFPVYEFAIRPEDPHISVSDEVSGRSLLEPYAYYRYSPSKLISFGYAIRTNIPLQDMPFYISHQSNIKLSLPENHSFRLSRSTQHQVELAQEAGEPVLYRSKQYSLDHSFDFGKLSTSNAVFFNNNDYRETERRVFGIESMWRYRYKSQSFVELTYTFLDARDRRDGNYYPSRYDLNYFVRFSAQHQFASQWTMTIRSLFREGTFYSPVTNTSFDNELNVFEPGFGSGDKRQRLPSYNNIDLAINKLWPLSKKLVLISFVSVSNALNFDNIRDYSYNFDYSEKRPNRFSQRTFYMGVVINFQ